MGTRIYIRALKNPYLSKRFVQIIVLLVELNLLLLVRSRDSRRGEVASSCVFGNGGLEC